MPVELRPLARPTVRGEKRSAAVPRPRLEARRRYPDLFQHALIDSVPIHGLARLVRARLVLSPRGRSAVESRRRRGCHVVIPWRRVAANPAAAARTLPRRTAPQVRDAVLVARTTRSRDVAAERGLVDWRTSRCGLGNDDGLREWLFVGTGQEDRLASNNCYPVGMFDWFRRDGAALAPGSTLLYADRTGARRRAVRARDAERLRAWLRNLAPALGLAYAEVGFRAPGAATRDAFAAARVVVGAHGAAVRAVTPRRCAAVRAIS